MTTESSFEALLNKHRVVIERYINFKLPNSFDADDVIQETYYAAYVGFSKLQNIESFKPWLLSIARNQCNIYFRKKYAHDFVPLEAVSQLSAVYPQQGDDEVSAVIKLLPLEYAEILKLYMNGYKQNEIASVLNVPLGTVKSRLHNARRQFRFVCSPEQISIFERGRKIMSNKDHTYPFPADMPTLSIKESNTPFFEVKCADEHFIIPIIGNKNSEGTYAYPEKKLALVSTCYVPKAVTVHEVPGVKVCRDTYNVRKKKLYKNESIWFSQLTDEYIRDLGCIANDSDDTYPTAIYTFLEEDYDIMVNGNDRVHGKPLLIKENPADVIDGKIYVDKYMVRYTMGIFDVTIGCRSFKTVKYILLQNNMLVTENYVDKNGRLVLVRWYESAESMIDDDASHDRLNKTAQNPKITVNDTEYRLIEDRISEYAL